MDDWRAQLGERLISAEAAAAMVQSGQSVAFTWGREAYAFGLALAARVAELEGVRIFCHTPGYDFGWYDDGWQDAFNVTVGYVTGTCQEAVDERRVDIVPGLLYTESRPVLWDDKPDFLVTEISPPDSAGMCSFGQSLWTKRKQIQVARQEGVKVIAEVNEHLIRTYGDNFINISEFDYFVEHVSSGAVVGGSSLGGRKRRTMDPAVMTIAGYVSELIRDGDCLQIGVGRTTEPLAVSGALDDKRDLGYHSEATPPGIITLVKKGIINGCRKKINTGKVTVTSLGGGTTEEMQWANGNQLFELVDFHYLEDPKNISANDNVVAINNALAIDLGGQITAETARGRLMATPGGQPSFVTGALLSRGGRSIHVLPSTADAGRVSRIVVEHPAGSLITVPRYCADIVVTEYGVAKLWGKTLRKRSEELIAIAHPDFRTDLTRETKRRLWP